MPILPFSFAVAFNGRMTNSSVRHAMELGAGTCWKPFRFEGATLAGTQPAHWTIEFGFEVIRARIRIGT